MQYVDPASSRIRRNTSLKPLVPRDAEPSLSDPLRPACLSHDRQRSSILPSKGPVQSATSFKVGGGSPKDALSSHTASERGRTRLNSIETSRRSASLISRTKRVSSDYCSIHDTQEDGGGSGKDSDSETDQEAQHVSDGRHQANLLNAMIGPTIYHEGTFGIQGKVDHRGMTPHVTFTTTHTPPSVAKTVCAARITCGFCSSTNLKWVLRCCFCGSARMSEAPRLKYLIDMILSIDPLIQPDNLAKRILEYAKFDRVALKAEALFKQAGLVRAKAAIMMMNRTVVTLRFQIMGMVFVAWKKAKAFSVRERAMIEHVLAIKETQTRRNCCHKVFSLWKGHVARVVDERLQRFQVAVSRNEATKLRRIVSNWRSCLYFRGQKKVEEVRDQYEKELRDTPLEAQKEIYRLRDVQQDLINLVGSAGDSLLELLQQSLQKADHRVLKTLQLVQMYPTTAGHFYHAAYGTELLNTLSTGHAMPPISGFGLDLTKDYETMKHLLAQTLETVETATPSDSLIQWLNFQRRRGAEISPKTVATPDPDDDVRGARRSRTNSTLKAPKSRGKERTREIKPIKTLQDLRTVLADPGAMLKLLCHTSTEAQIECDQSLSAEATSMSSTDTTATTLSPAAQVQLRTYFKLVPRLLHLPPDLITRDSFVLNDFDSLYAYAVYLYLVHPNYVAPGVALAPRLHIQTSYFTTQWQSVHSSLREQTGETFAQQQVSIFLSKLQRINGSLLRYLAICKAVREIASCHERQVVREAFNEFSRRVLCKDSNVSVSLEKETLASSLALPATKLLTFCQDEHELRLIEQVYKDNVLELMKLFRLYGTAAGGKGILEQEFLKVMTKAGVTHKKNILRSTLQLIYQQSRASTAGGSSPLTGAENDDENEDRGASPNEFFEALTRVAYHNFQKRRDLSGQGESREIDVEREVSAGTCTLLSCVVDLVVAKLLPLTKKAQEQGLTFKKQMIYPDVQSVCKAQEKKLKRIFSAYSQRNKNPGSRGKLLDVSDFELLLKDRRLLDALFPYGKLKQLVAFVQQDGEVGNAANGYEVENEIVFTEFVEALSAIAVYRNANPYLPFAKKLETFFDECF